MKSQISKITEYMPITLLRVMTLRVRRAQDASKNGMDSFNKIRAVIVNGLNTVTNGLTHIGSKELMLAMFPVPKKPSNMNVS